MLGDRTNASGDERGGLKATAALTTLYRRSTCRVSHKVAPCAVVVRTPSSGEIIGEPSIIWNDGQDFNPIYELKLKYCHLQQDLTFCYLHMTRHDLQILDTLESPEYIKGDISDDGLRIFEYPSRATGSNLFAELDIPSHMVPPNPDDSDSALAVATSVC